MSVLLFAALGLMLAFGGAGLRFLLPHLPSA
jgi:hypothetical protein